MLLVSHDLEEAVYLADQVLLLTKRPTRVTYKPVVLEDHAAFAVAPGSLPPPQR